MLFRSDSVSGGSGSGSVSGGSGGRGGSDSEGSSPTFVGNTNIKDKTTTSTSTSTTTTTASANASHRYSNNPPAGIDAVFKWRLQAEKTMKVGLTDQQVADFVSRFMPAYVTYLPALYSTGPERRVQHTSRDLVPIPGQVPGYVEGQVPGKVQGLVPDLVPVLKITVDIDRFPISAEYL